MSLFRNKVIKYCYKNTWRQFTSQERKYQEVSIKVPWGQIAGKWWEPYDTRPILTTHGWQDNCGSFDRLIPMLSRNVGFLAIDFPGHGYSSRIPLGMYYSTTLYQVAVRCVVDYFKWSKVSLMGHSFGGITSFVHAMLYPEEIDFILCLDAFKPFTHSDYNSLAKQIKKFLQTNKFAEDIKEPPSYTLEEITKKVCVPNVNSICPEVAHYVIERNVASSKLHPGKFYFTIDPRLKSTITTKFSQAEILGNAKSITAPIFIAKSSDGPYYGRKENYYKIIEILKKASKECVYKYIDGTHHVHLNNPENEAALITDFIERNIVEDRSIGGIKEEIIVPKQKIKLTKKTT